MGRAALFQIEDKDVQAVHALYARLAKSFHEKAKTTSMHLHNYFKKRFKAFRGYVEECLEENFKHENPRSLILLRLKFTQDDESVCNPCQASADFAPEHMDCLRYLLVCTLIWWLNATAPGKPLQLASYDANAREIMRRFLQNIYGCLKGSQILQVFERQLYVFLGG